MMQNALILWAIVSGGTLLFLFLLVISSFYHGGSVAFRKLNISYLTLSLVIVFASIAFPCAWTLLHRLIKES
jgi:hypothetical protein